MTNDFDFLNKDSRTFLSRGYLAEGVTAEQRIKKICDTSEGILGIEGFSDKLYKYCSKGWVSFSSPVWSNFGLKALPISCFGSVYDDSVAGMLETCAEIGMMTKQGGGTSLHIGNVRERGASISVGGTADGPVHYCRPIDTIIDTFQQAETRRGSCAITLEIEHPDIEEFLEIKHEGNPIQNLQFSVSVGDIFMREMIEGDRQKRKVWAKVLKSRSDIGFPYIFYRDNANNTAPMQYVVHNKKILATNLCTEIMLSSNINESFVCCLSSVNLLHYEDWRNTDLVETMIYFLDSVMTEFIRKASNIPYMGKAVKFAKEQRALGLGVLGYHSLLQSKMIPIESMEAKYLNSSIFKLIREKSDLATVSLAKTFGVPLLMQGTNRRNATTMAVAPTKSSSFILGQVSMGIEPIKSNYFIKDLAKVKSVYKNPHLKTLLLKIGLDNEGVWKSILDKDGSVQHLKELTDRERNVFKTFMEISPMELVQQNATRQKFVDQGISFNLSIHPDTPAKDINKLYIEAWKLGIKSLYYQFSESSAQNFARNINECISCQ